MRTYMTPIYSRRALATTQAAADSRMDSAAAAAGNNSAAHASGVGGPSVGMTKAAAVASSGGGGSGAQTGGSLRRVGDYIQRNAPATAKEAFARAHCRPCGPGTSRAGELRGGGLLSADRSRRIHDQMALAGQGEMDLNRESSGGEMQSGGSILPLSVHDSMRMLQQSSGKRRRATYAGDFERSPFKRLRR